MVQGGRIALEHRRVTANCLNRRGPVIVVTQKVKDTWSLARTMASDPKLDEKLASRASSSADVEFVADFIAEEFGNDFELVDLLKKRIPLGAMALQCRRPLGFFRARAGRNRGRSSGLGFRLSDGR